MTFTLLAEFRKTKQHIAIVLDEYSSFEVIVTLESLTAEAFDELGRRPLGDDPAAAEEGDALAEVPSASSR